MYRTTVFLRNQLGSSPEVLDFRYVVPPVAMFVYNTGSNEAVVNIEGGETNVAGDHSLFNYTFPTVVVAGGVQSFILDVVPNFISLYLSEVSNGGVFVEFVSIGTREVPVL